ncbi:MAG TPA: TylF/MycF/NovP-related O-methyltransferase [Prosthecobacter sp.]|nr:TylF/MycF/NovP-related O-methyltransferase [Prosthecobacter sp.]
MRLKSLLRFKLDQFLSRFGYLRCLNDWNSPFDIPEEDKQAAFAVQEFTMTSLERRYHLLQSVRHIVKHRIPGSIVECGVWRGGSMMLVAKTLMECGDTSRDLYLYDTFEGMSAPTEADRDFAAKSAASRLQMDAGMKAESGVWAISGLDEVKRNMASTGYPAERIHYVQGKVEDTIPATVPDQIALLRLDTDWYESTAHELTHLYPRLVGSGVLIIDDYGYWQGARKAVDEFLAQSPDKLLLHRIDNNGRGMVKP